MRAVNLAVTSLLSAAGSKGLFDGQVDACRLSTDLGSCLKTGGWEEGGQMPIDRVIKFIEFVFYMVVIKVQFRKSSSSLTYKHTGRLYDFVKKNSKPRSRTEKVIPYLLLWL